MNNAVVIPLASCIVSFIFALAVLDQFLVRRKPYQLIWMIGLLMYSISTGAEFWVGLHIRLGGAINLFYIFELLGIIIIFVGFLRSKGVFGVYRFPIVHGVRGKTIAQA